MKRERVSNPVSLPCRYPCQNGVFVVDSCSFGSFVKSSQALEMLGFLVVLPVGIEPTTSPLPRLFCNLEKTFITIT
jgi:hypothetical protein